MKLCSYMLCLCVFFCLSACGLKTPLELPSKAQIWDKSYALIDTDYVA